MLITITELGSKSYTVDFWRTRYHTWHCFLTPELFRCIKARCQPFGDPSPEFGEGLCGRQVQYVKGGLPWMSAKN